MPEGKTVSNSSCLIALEAIGLLSILEKLYTGLTLPEAVAREIGAKLPVWIEVESVRNQQLVQSLQVELGAGEAEAIALSMEVKPARLILDDKKARRFARQLGLPVTGTLAILVRAKQQGFVTNVRDAIASLGKANFYVSASLAQEMIRLAGE